MEQIIVTFWGSKSVHVYPPNSGLVPVEPCELHTSVSEAKKYLSKRDNVCSCQIKIVEY